jgi:D,D-heptose 1,7-bisphosphate phosphatase
MWPRRSGGVVTQSRPIAQAVVLAPPQALSAMLADVRGRPFITQVLREAARAGVNDLLLLTASGADHGLLAFEGQSVGEARCRVLAAPDGLGSAGGLRHVASALDDCFYVLHGDRTFDFDLNTLVPLGPDCLGVIAVREAAAGETGRRVILNRSGAVASVTGFDPSDDANTAKFIDSGVCALSREALGIAGDGRSLEHDLLPALAAAGRLSAVEGHGYFIDMSQPGSLEKACSDLPAALRRPAVFFDRDGVLNHDNGYTYRAEDLRLIDGVVETIRRCNRSNRYVFVVTNQSGVARGLYTIEAVRAFHAAMQQQLRRAGAHIDGLYICPHHPDGTVEAYSRACDCRKPNPGMLRQALAEWPIDAGASIMIGDRPSDIAAAAACGIRGFQFGGGNLERFCELHGVI